jgi:diphthamide biosynthesis protein 2
MTHSNMDMYAYDPESGARECMGTSRLLSRRLFAVHQALAADVFGLVVGNIGLASSRPLLAHLRSQLAAKGKKSYTLSVGRLNPAKLANFADIECFVLVGCAEGGIVDSKVSSVMGILSTDEPIETLLIIANTVQDFLRPIITPYELTLALTGAEWDPSSWTLDLARVLATVSQEEAKGPETGEAAGGDANDSEEELEFSLVTGTYRTRKVFNSATGPSASAGEAQGRGAITAGADGVKDVTVRSDFSVAKLESAGSMFLESRSFRGLEPRYGLDEPALLEQGRSGIARGYTEEK